MSDSAGIPKSGETLRSLFDRIISARAIRDENTKLQDSIPPVERPFFLSQSAVLAQAVREELEALAVVSDLLILVPHLQKDWPYPTDETLRSVRTELATRTEKSPDEVNDVPLNDLVGLLGGPPPSANGHKSAAASTIIGPTRMAALPRWARIAFAARSARRVERLLEEAAPEMPNEELECIGTAIQLAEDSAAQAMTVPGTAEAAERVLTILELMRPKSQMNGSANGRAMRSNLAGLLNSSVGYAAAASARAAVSGNPETAFQGFLMSTLAGTALSSTAVISEMLRDFHYLDARSKKEQWTDSTPVPPSAIPQPNLKLVGLHIRNLRAIRRLDLPQDGLGWKEQIPDLMVLGGINGTGKTTLLQFIATVLEELTRTDRGLNYSDKIDSWLADLQEAWLEFELQSLELSVCFRLLFGSREFIQANGGDCYWGVTAQDGGGFITAKGSDLQRIRLLVKSIGRSSMPTVVYMPSHNRNLVVPDTDYKAAGKLTESSQFIHRWEPPQEWKDSPEALLYSLRWEDLNAKEEGQIEPNHFHAYAEAFRRFTGDTKSLQFVDGRLVVRIADTGATHELSQLSSGEQHMLLLTGELLRYWRPGSLILIDEPELHLHIRWQTELYRALRFWQKERGGQVILATQSAHLASLAGVGSGVLLGVESL